ncbi:hypothetical protein [Pseudoxanthomonas sp.]|jgi:hypothetical protein|uniref:hypothetical protein n=1 Tax=Pseudoxanthomonas sp. TaxID=1871049 RepID=UPI002FE0CEF0
MVTKAKIGALLLTLVSTVGLLAVPLAAVAQDAGGEEMEVCHSGYCHVYWYEDGFLSYWYSYIYLMIA